MEEAHEEHEKLKADYFSLKQQLEDVKQELHECRRDLKVVESLQEDYKNEINMLQTEEIRQKQKYQKIIKQLEQNITHMRESHNDEKQTLEDAIMKMEEKHELVLQELDHYKCPYSNSSSFVGDTSSLINEILSEPPEFYENQQLKESLKDVNETNEHMKKQLEDYVEEVRNLKESMDCTRTELSEMINTNQFLNDENLLLKSELNSSKNQPLNKDSKGNSLFAEVNDRRVYLQDKINKMKSSYEKMRQENVTQQNTIRHLRMENLKLIHSMKSDAEEKDEDNHAAIASLRATIKNLEEQIEKYKANLSEKPVIMSERKFEGLEYYSRTLSAKNKEIEELRDEIRRKHVDRFVLVQEMQESNVEKRKYRLKAIEKEHELEILKLEMMSYVKPEKACDENVDNETKNDLKENSTPLTNNVESNRILKGCMTIRRLSDIQEKSELSTYIKDGINSGIDEDETLTIEYANIERRTYNEQETGMLNDKNVSCDDKENVPVNKETEPQVRTVTFAANTLSPKKTGRRGGTRIIQFKPIYFKD